MKEKILETLDGEKEKLDDISEKSSYISVKTNVNYLLEESKDENAVPNKTEESEAVNLPPDASSKVSRSIWLSNANNICVLLYHYINYVKNLNMFKIVAEH